MDKYHFKALDKVEPHRIVKKVWLFSLLTIGLLVSLLFLPWQQTVKGKGVVIALDSTERDYSILAPVDGFIEKFYVKENQFVKKGEALFKMVDLDNEYLLKLENIRLDLEHQIENTKLEIVNLKQQIIETKKYLDNGIYVYEQKILQVREKIKSIELKKIFLEKSYEIKKSNFERISSLYKDGIESKRKYELAENSYIKADAESQKVNIDIVVEKQNIVILKKEIEKFLTVTQNKLHSFDNKVLNVQNRKTGLGQQLYTQSIKIQRYKNSEVIAPKDGYVIRILKSDQNRYLKKGEGILHFAPKVTQKSIFLKVLDFNMPLIKEDLPVRIMFHGWPALQVSGWPEIQFGSFGGVVKTVEHISHEKGYYYSYITEDSHGWPKGDILRMGTQATVWVRLSTVPIWYHIWRSINAVPPQMVDPKTKER